MLITTVPRPLRRTLMLLSTILCVCLSTPGLRGQAASSARPLIQGPIDESVRVTLKDGVRPQTRQDIDVGVLGGDVPLDRIILLLKRSQAAQAAFDQLQQEQQDPKSPLFHQWLTPAQIGRQFGAAPADRTLLLNWLQGYGFHIDSFAKSGLMVVFSGSEAQLEAAFDTSMHSYRSIAGDLHVANSREPSIPAALAPLVAGIASLNNYPVKPLSRIYGAAHLNRGADHAAWSVQPGVPAELTGKASAGAAPANPINPEFSASVGPHPFQLVSPYDFAAIYNVAPLWNAGIDGTGETVAVLAVSDINPGDVDSFRAAFGLPAKPVNMVYYGPNPGLGAAEGEADLDAEWSGAVAKNADIDVVVAQDTQTTSGVILGAYDVIDNNLASVMSVSFGECEYGLGNAGNLLISNLWEQAAAEGITVIVASGDAGSAACDQGSPQAAQLGLSVSGFASTPYNIAVGGTDLYGTYTDPAGSWGATNDPTTLQSALGYISEIPWNDSCGNPEYLAAAVKAGQVADTTVEQFCNDSVFFPSGPSVQGGGGGGESGCIQSDELSAQSCAAGYSPPAWQKPVVQTQFRSLPDVSLFAGNGLWAAAYVYCESDATPDGVCNNQSSQDLNYLVAGGTSFGSPAFAGIVALINQKTGSRQGNAAPTLYQLFDTQVAAKTPCDTGSVTAGSGCFFQDVSAGSIAEPCYSGTFGCFPSDPSDGYAVLGGYSARAGFDSATGLGSVNAANLVNGWTTAAGSFTPTQTSLSVTKPTMIYGTADTVSVTVSASGATPTGDVSAVATGFGNGPFTLDSSGTAAFAILDLPAGTHAVSAHYAGNGTYAPSDSSPVSITVSQAATSLTAQSSVASLSAGGSVTFSSTVATTSKAASPAGTVTFTDSTSGAVVATAPVQAGTDAGGDAKGTVEVTVPAHLFSDGANAIVAAYSGDANYLASTATPIAIAYKAPFALSVAGSPLTIPAQGSASATVTVTSSADALAQSVFLACPQALPAGLSCAFSPAILPAGSKSVTSTLTIYASSALARAAAPALPFGSRRGRAILAAASFAGLFFFLGFGHRKARRALRGHGLFVLAFCLLGLSGALSITGCGGGSSAPPTPASVALSASTPAAAAGSPVTFTAKVTPPQGGTAGLVPVSFLENGTALGTATLDAQGTATFTTTALPVGPNSVYASYPGAGKSGPATSQPASTDVTFSASVLLSASDNAGNASSTTLSVTVK